MHEKGLMFMDMRQGALFVPYTDLSKITFFEDGLSSDSNKNIWAQFTLKTLDRVPFA